jgi:hypothetical protein
LAATPQASSVGSLVIEERTSTAWGDVLVASQPGLGRRVLVRCLRRDAQGNAAVVERFRREARMTARVSHGSVQQAFDLFAWHGDHYLVLEHVEGESLRSWLDQLGRPPREVAAYIALELARGIEALHAAGVIHANLRAESVRIGRWGEVKIGELGWARASTENGVPGPEAGPHLAPELSEGGPPDTRSDVFALAVAIRELLGGRPPRWLRKALHRDPQRRPAASALRFRLEPALLGTSATSARAQTAAWLLQRVPAGEQPDPAAGAPPREPEAVEVRRGRWRSKAARAAAATGAAAGLIAAAIVQWGGEPPGSALLTASLAGKAAAPDAADDVGTETLDRQPPSVSAGAPAAPPLPDARVRFAVFPWGEIRIDGGEPIVTPQAAPVALAPGIHQIEISHPTLGRERREITLSAGEQRTLRHVFDRTTPQ